MVSSSPDTAATRRWAALGWVPGALLGLVVLWLHSRRHFGYMADDAFISLRYARRLLDGHGLTWTNGEWVEGYSNLLWVLVCAAGGVTGLDLVFVARALGTLGMAVAVVAVAVGRRPFPAAVASVAVALSGPIAVWAVGGLEQGLLAALLGAGMLALLERKTPLAAVLLGLVCLTRPDGILLAATAGGTAALARRSWRDAATLLGVPLGLVLAQELFRLGYYGDVVPNTAYAKLALSSTRVWTGLASVVTGAWPLAGLLALAAMALLRPNARVLIVGVPLLAWAAYVVFIGGDIFAGRRHLVPLVVLLGFLAGDGISRWRWPWVALPILVVHGWLQLGVDPEYRRTARERWEWDAAVIGEAAKANWSDEAPLLAVDAAGSLPYHSELPALDMLGLNDRYLAHHPPPAMGQHGIGHELGDGAYVLSREPDLVVFCHPMGRDRPCFTSGLQMIDTPAFRNGYELVRFEVQGRTEPVRWLVWVRREGRVGIARTPTRVTIPAPLFGSGRSARAVIDPEQGVWSEVREGVTERVELALDAGTWTATAELPVTVRRDGVDLGTRFELDQPATVLVEVRGRGATRFRAAVFSRP